MNKPYGGHFEFITVKIYANFANNGGWKSIMILTPKKRYRHQNQLSVSFKSQHMGTNRPQGGHFLLITMQIHANHGNKDGRKCNIMISKLGSLASKT